MQETTIAAIATGMVGGGISIIRISGKEAVDIADKIFEYGNGLKLSDSQSHLMHYGKAVYQGKLIDECMAVVMRAPKSYTCEDCVEIHCHGGALVTNTILDAIISLGAKPAEPGEFTKRAFLNGRIDLTEAEAVMDVISAESKFALDCSVNQLNGSLKNKIIKLRAEILEETAFIEAALDDPEHYELDNYGEKLKITVDKVLAEVNKLIETFDDGRLIKDGIKTVILGKPNAGKSSVLNYLSGRERAIVTDIPGTTRDTLEESIILDGLNLVMIDTAGIHETEDTVEKIGIRRAKESAGEADLILYVVDSAISLDDSDEEILELIKDKKAVVLLNKSDLDAVTTEKIINEKTSFPVVKISAKEEKGKEELGSLLKTMFFKGNIEFNIQVYITNLRQKNLLMEARENLIAVEESLLQQLPEDFYFIDLIAAYTNLGSVIGATFEEDLVNEIFGKFCMGK